MATTPEQIQAFKNRNQSMLRTGFGTTIADTAATVRGPYVNATPVSNDPPAKAPAAPKGATKDVFTGLAEALNTWQQKLVQEGKYTYPDEYVIQFNPATMAAAKLKRQGETDKNKIGMQNDNSAANQLNPTKQSADLNSRTLQVSAGMQIVQFIDMVMRNSTYVTDQQTAVYNDGTQQLEPNNNNPNGQTAWYKINVEATQLKYDPQRRDHAYRMTYMITPYAVNTMQSDYFPNSRYRGSHKRYNYWFTGANNEILNFEQDFNYLYRLIISGNAPKIRKSSTTDFRGRDQYRKTFAATSEENAKGADGYTNEPGDNAADFLYSPSDQAKIKLKIVGDPAWMQQGELSGGLAGFNFNPFNSDGGINFDSQEVVFDVSWNRPADYNFDTGIVEVNQRSNNATGPSENATYTAIKCRNTFSKGKFEQEIEGRLLMEVDTGKQTTEGRSQAGASATQNTSQPNTSRTSGTNGVQTFDDGTTLQTFDDGSMLATGTDGSITSSPAPDSAGSQSDSAPQPINSPAPDAPTSNGDISSYGEQNELPNPSPATEATSTISPDYNAGLAGTTTGTTQLMDREA